MDHARFPDCVKLLDHLGLYLRDHAKVRILVISELGEPLVDVNRCGIIFLSCFTPIKLIVITTKGIYV